MTIIAGTLLDNAGAIYNVKNSDFAGGAKGDGITDDHAAITAAIAAATATGGVVYFPPGTYLVSQKLDGVPGKRNVLVGANRDSCIIKRTSGTGGVLDWKTVGFNHLVAEFSCRVEELTFDGSNNTGVVVDIQDLSLMRMCRVNITGNGLAGPAANCIGLRLSSMWDCHFEDIYVTSCGGTGVNGACVLLDTRVIASDSLNNCQFHNLHIEPGPCDAILLQFAANSSSEIGDNYFFGLKTHGNLATGQPNNPLVKMSQFARANAFFGHVIAFGNSATLGQIECDGQRNVWYSPTIGISGGGPATDPAYAFRFTGNAVDNVIWCANLKTPTLFRQAPFRGESGSIHNKVIFPHGSGFPSVILSDAGRNILWWDDINTNAGLVLRGADGLAFDTVTGISGTATQAKNLRGTATLTGTAKAVNIPIALEPDTNYRVVATASFTGGTPAAGSNRLWVSNKTTGQFTINVEVAPGTGNTVSFDWVLIR